MPLPCQTLESTRGWGQHPSRDPLKDFLGKVYQARPPILSSTTLVDTSWRAVQETRLSPVLGNHRVIIAFSTAALMQRSSLSSLNVSLCRPLNTSIGDQPTSRQLRTSHSAAVIFYGATEARGTAERRPGLRKFSCWSSTFDGSCVNVLNR